MSVRNRLRAKARVRLRCDQGYRRNLNARFVDHMQMDPEGFAMWLLGEIDQPELLRRRRDIRDARQARLRELIDCYAP